MKVLSQETVLKAPAGWCRPDATHGPRAANNELIFLMVGFRRKLSLPNDTFPLRFRKLQVSTLTLVKILRTSVLRQGCNLNIGSEYYVCWEIVALLILVLFNINVWRLLISTNTEKYKYNYKFIKSSQAICSAKGIKLSIMYKMIWLYFRIRILFLFSNPNFTKFIEVYHPR